MIAFIQRVTTFIITLLSLWTTHTVADNHQPKVQIELPECLQIAYDRWVPYSFPNANFSGDGTDVRIAEATIAAAGFCSESVYMDKFEDILRAIREGSTDVTYGTSVTPERLTYGAFSNHYRTETLGIFGRSDIEKTIQGWRNKPLEELLEQPGFLLGIVKGYRYGEKFEGKENLVLKSSEINDQKTKSVEEHGIREVYGQKLVPNDNEFILPREALKANPKYVAYLSDLLSGAYVLAEIEQADTGLRSQAVVNNPSDSAVKIVNQNLYFSRTNVAFMFSIKGLSNKLTITNPPANLSAKELNELKIDAFIHRINTALAELKQNGTIKNIMAEFVPQLKQ